MQNASARTLPFMDEAHRGAQPSDCPDREHLTIHCLSPSTQSGLGSPGLFDDRGRRATMAGRRPPVQEPSSQSGNLPSHPARRGETDMNPLTAQLTVIYAGMVHVHDDLPFDKAQVIMHLAGSGNNISRSGSGAFSPARPLSALTAVPQLVTPMLGSTAPQAPTPSTAGLTCRIIPGVMRRAPTANGFPNSIKAEVEECSPDKSPTPSSMPSSRSPSPVSAVQHRGSSLASSLGCQHGTSSCSQPDSPAISSLTSPRESASEEKSSIGTHYRRDHDMKQEAHKRPRTGRSPPRIDGETAADA